MLTCLCISVLLRLQNQSSERKDQHLHQNPHERRGTSVRSDRPEGGRHHGQARDSVRRWAFFPHPGVSEQVAPTNSIPCHPGQTTIQVRVPYRMVGLVVGPKGATIKRIQQQTHTYIVTPSRDKEPVFEVTGMPENVDRAREEIEAHIVMRTAGSVDTTVDDDDFHYNGTDVGVESGSNGAWLFSGGVSSFHSKAAGYRNDSSSSLGSNSNESYYSGKGSAVADLSPGSRGGTFWFGDSQVPLGSEDPAGYEGLTMTAPSANPTLWSALEQGGVSLPTTPRLSPSILAVCLRLFRRIIHWFGWCRRIPRASRPLVPRFPRLATAQAPALRRMYALTPNTAKFLRAYAAETTWRCLSWVGKTLFVWSVPTHRERKKLGWGGVNWVIFFTMKYFFLITLK